MTTDYWVFEAKNATSPQRKAEKIIQELIEKWKDKDKPEGALFPSEELDWHSTITRWVLKSKGLTSVRTTTRWLDGS